MRGSEFHITIHIWQKCRFLFRFGWYCDKNVIYAFFGWNFSWNFILV